MENQWHLAMGGVVVIVCALRFNVELQKGIATSGRVSYLHCYASISILGSDPLHFFDSIKKDASNEDFSVFIFIHGSSLCLFLTRIKIKDECLKR